MKLFLTISVRKIMFYADIYFKAYINTVNRYTFKNYKDSQIVFVHKELNNLFLGFIKYTQLNIPDLI